ncbi:hypothetical protein CPB85DRAFT_1338817 [Mucidula mucida]|nr:hypothetical protein CPB85DRAFT_1338817 [Mucidula mucida]
MDYVTNFHRASVDQYVAEDLQTHRKNNKSPALWSYRQDHNALVGCNATISPDVISVAERLWRESLNGMRTNAGPENPMGWPQTQVIHDLKPDKHFLDRGSTSPFTILGLNGLDPRDLRERIHAAAKAEKREGLAPDLSNSLRAKKRPFQSSPADMPVAKRSKSNALPLPTIAASVGQAPAAPTIQGSDDAQKRHSASLQCARYALEVLSSAGFRSHRFGLLIGVNEIQVLYYDRSIIAVSQPFTMVDLKRKELTPTVDERRFVALLICLQRATLAQRGIMEYLMPDPFLEIYQNYTEGMAADPKTLFKGRKIKLNVNGRSVLVKLGRILVRQAGIIGRNTCVVEATSTAWPGKDLVVKISWPAASRVPENTFVDKITETVRAEGNNAAWVLDHIPTVLHSQDFALPPDAPGSRLREYLAGPGVTFAEGKERLQRLDTLTKPEDYAQVLFDVLQVHRWIYDFPRIIHRDLSHGNIMWHCRNGRIRGVLNDFDFVPGTRPFMAHELHDVDANGDPPVHLYRHDLESIFYIIILLTCAYALRTEPGDDGSYLDTIPSSTYGFPILSFCGFTDWIKDMHTQFKKASPLYEEDEEDGDGDEETDQDDDDMDVDAVAAFDNETMDGAVSYDIILTIMKTFGKNGRGKNRRGKKQSLEMMYPTAKKD